MKRFTEKKVKEIMNKYYVEFGEIIFKRIEKEKEKPYFIAIFDLEYFFFPFDFKKKFLNRRLRFISFICGRSFDNPKLISVGIHFTEKN